MFSEEAELEDLVVFMGWLLVENYFEGELINCVRGWGGKIPWVARMFEKVLCW